MWLYIVHCKIVDHVLKNSKIVKWANLCQLSLFHKQNRGKKEVIVNTYYIFKKSYKVNVVAIPFAESAGLISGNHILIANLNALTTSNFLTSLGTTWIHISGPKWSNQFELQFNVLIGLLANVCWFLRMIEDSGFRGNMH